MYWLSVVGTTWCWLCHTTKHLHCGVVWSSFLKSRSRFVCVAHIVGIPTLQEWRLMTGISTLKEIHWLLYTISRYIKRVCNWQHNITLHFIPRDWGTSVTQNYNLWTISDTNWLSRTGFEYLRPDLSISDPIWTSWTRFEHLGPDSWKYRLSVSDPKTQLPRKRDESWTRNEKSLEATIKFLRVFVSDPISFEIPRAHGIRIRVCVWVRVRVCVCLWLWMWVCVCLCEWVCVCVCVD